MELIGGLVLVIVGVVVGSSVGYLVWRILDRSDTDDLRRVVEGLENRVKAWESGRTSSEDGA
mgnify:CR=1 FL=1